MEVQKRKKEPTTLEEELNFWIRQEQKFRSLFGKEMLKEGAFLKMKLRHYDSLWYKYKNAPLGIEGQLMRNMLKFQRRKLDKSMNRGLLQKIFRRITIAIEYKRAKMAQRRIQNENRPELYNENSPNPGMNTQKKNAVVLKRKEEQKGRVITRTEQAMQKPENTKQKQTIHYAYNHTPGYKHKRRINKGVHY